MRGRQKPICLAAALLALLVVLSLTACGGTSPQTKQASVEVTVPAVLRPIPSGSVFVQVLASDARGASPVAAVSTASDRCALSVAPGSYVVRVSDVSGHALESPSFTVGSGGTVSPTFPSR